MPPHCDSLDGPVVTAARQALDSRDVDRVLPFVPDDGEGEIREIFATVLPVRELGGPARDVADRLFFETVVRVHRAGEGAPYTGLKPAGLPVGPVIPLAEKAVDTGSPQELTHFLSDALAAELKTRLDEVVALSAAKDASVAEARRYVAAKLGFEVHSHSLYEAIHAPAHGEGGGHSHG